MLEELPEEGERDPAANSRYDGSYTGQNVRAEMIPDGKVKVSAQLYANFFFLSQFNEDILCTFKAVLTLLGWRHCKPCTSTRTIEIKHLDGILKSAVQSL